MRIAIVSAHSCPLGTLGTKDTGGMSVYTVEIARELGKAGHTVDAYTRMHALTDPVEVDLGENARLIHIEAGEIARMHKMEVYTHLPEFADNLEAYRQEQGFEYDLVFSHYWLSALVGEQFSRWWDVPHVTMFHTLGAVKNQFAICDRDPEIRISSEGELARNVLYTIAPTEREKAELVNRYGAAPERVGVVPCGVNPDLFIPMDRNESREKVGITNGRIMLYAGRIDPLKGISNLIATLPFLEKQHEVKLVIVGDEQTSEKETSKLKALIRNLGVEDSVVFTGAVKQDMMPYYYSAADVCVVPSYYESFGLVALESLSCGTPVVANDVGDLKNILRPGKTGYVTRSNEPAVLAESISRVFTENLAPSFSIRDSVKEYSWSVVAGLLDVEFRKLLCRYRIPVS